MSSPITYFAIVGNGTTIEQPLGLVRRLAHDKGWADEALHKDMGWHWTPVIVEWEHDSYGNELVEVSHEQADEIIQYFRKKYSADT